MSAQVHVAHCCIEHGCKYGEAVCPVVDGHLKQKYPCELCEGTLPFELEWQYLDQHDNIWHAGPEGKHLDDIKAVFRHELADEVVVTYSKIVKVKYRKKE